MDCAGHAVASDAERAAGDESGSLAAVRPAAPAFAGRPKGPDSGGWAFDEMAAFVWMRSDWRRESIAVSGSVKELKDDLGSHSVECEQTWPLCCSPMASLG